MVISMEDGSVSFAAYEMSVAFEMKNKGRHSLCGNDGQMSSGGKAFRHIQ
jgi:hypothetical protein